MYPFPETQVYRFNRFFLWHACNEGTLKTFDSNRGQKWFFVLNKWQNLDREGQNEANA